MASNGGTPVYEPPEVTLRRLQGKRSLLRSEPMVMVQMIVQADAASETVEELGAMGSVMFCDLNEARRHFSETLRRR